MLGFDEGSVEQIVDQAVRVLHSESDLSKDGNLTSSVIALFDEPAQKF